MVAIFLVSCPLFLLFFFCKPLIIFNEGWNCVCRVVFEDCFEDLFVGSFQLNVVDLHRCLVDELNLGDGLTCWDVDCLVCCVHEGYRDVRV